MIYKNKCIQEQLNSSSFVCLFNQTQGNSSKTAFECERFFRSNRMRSAK